MVTKILIKDLANLKNFTKDFLVMLKTVPQDQAVVLGISGDLGAGKTTFVQFLAQTLGVNEVVTSPTFVLIKNYPLESSTGFKELIHMDAYRIEELSELKPLRFEELLATAGNLVCIEWAEKISSALPVNTVYLNFEITANEERTVTIKLVEPNV